jgi:hypothetical protein
MDDMRCIPACLPWITLTSVPPRTPSPISVTATDHHLLIFSSRQEKTIEDKPSIFTIFFLLFHDVGHKRLTQVAASL